MAQSDHKIPRYVAYSILLAAIRWLIAPHVFRFYCILVGTHVAGVIGASGNNNAGMQGVIGDGNFCFLIARVFGETGSGARMSDILEAVEWMVDHKANIINMSLGSGEYTKLGDEIMQYAYEEGILLIGSSGNDGK